MTNALPALPQALPAVPAVRKASVEGKPPLRLLLALSALMSLGMMMLSPVLVSLPFKLMLFVLADGWNLLLGSLAASFVT